MTIDENTSLNIIQDDESDNSESTSCNNLGGIYPPPVIYLPCSDDENNNKDPATRDASLTKNKKRRIDNGHDIEKDALSSSVMSKTERVPAFSFSFL